MSLLLAADACLSWFCHLSQSNKSVLTGILSSCMQHWLKNHWPDQALFKHSLHTDCISNSAILHNNYISLLSDCALVHVKKKWHHKGSHSSKVSGSNCLVRLQTWKKWWAGALLSVKCCCFGQKIIMKESRKFELPLPSPSPLTHKNKENRSSVRSTIILHCWDMATWHCHVLPSPHRHTYQW